MIDIKRGTQTAPKTQTMSSFKSEGASSLAAGEFEKAFGQQSVGDVLNKVADKNWVDPSKKMRAVGNDQLDKDAFMKLMLAQMKHQDPTKPMESHEMAAQLAQFTSLEQLSNINKTLEGMKKEQSPGLSFQALSLIGKKVSGDSSKLSRAAGDTKHSFSFDLMGDAAKVKVSVTDAEGKVIRKMELGETKKGRGSIDWNGLTDDGLPARAGEYRFEAEALNANGGKVHARTSFDGRITGLNFTNEGPILLVGGSSIKLSDVKKIEEAPADGLMPMAGALAQGPARPRQTEELIPPAQEAEPIVKGNIHDVPMEQALLNRLAKAEGKR